MSRLSPVLMALLLARARAQDDFFDVLLARAQDDDFDVGPPMKRSQPPSMKRSQPPLVVRCPTEREMRAQAKSWRKAARRLENAQRTAEGRARSRDRGKR